MFVGVVLGEYEYYFIDPLTCDPYQVSESDFDNIIFKYRDLYVMEYDKDDINRQNFYDRSGYLQAYRIKKKMGGDVFYVG